MRKPLAPRGTGGFPFHCNPRFARDFGLTAEKRSQRDKGSKSQSVHIPSYSYLKQRTENPFRRLVSYRLTSTLSELRLRYHASDGPKDEALHQLP